MPNEVTPEFVRRLAAQADQLAEDRVERNARIHELETVLERLVDAIGDVRISGMAVRTYALHEAWKDARDALASREERQ